MSKIFGKFLKTKSLNFQDPKLEICLPQRRLWPRVAVTSVGMRSTIVEDSVDIVGMIN